MNSREFCYWLQGYFEIVSASSNREPDGLTSGQVEMIQKHLNMVFFHEIDPSYPAEQQDGLNKLHEIKPVNVPANTIPQLPEEKTHGKPRC